MASVFDHVERITASPVVSVAVAVAVSFAVYILGKAIFRQLPVNSPKKVSEDWPILGAISFWTRRWDFYQTARQHSPTGNFTFHAGEHQIVALSGDKGRQLFFESKDLGFAEGYAVLFGQSPKVPKEQLNVQQEPVSNYFSRRITRMLKQENFGKALPTLMSDVQKAIEALGPQGITDPFESIYKVVFQLTIRMVGCDDIAEDEKLLDNCLYLYELIDGSATATAVMFPKFPSPAIIKRTYAGGRLYMLLKKIVDERKATGQKRDDPLQFLIDQGDSMGRIIEFVVGALFAGLLNSGINAAWVLVYLSKDAYWREKVREEVYTVAARYAKNKSAPIMEQLADVPVEAWESEFPIVDMCLRDSIRLNLLGTAFRKNISGRAIPTGNGNEVIPPDAFVTYATGDIHLDPSVYPDPYRWDPARYTPERAEDKKKTYGFVGWGAARHPCLGMRFAKLEQNIITAFFLSTFDYDLTDKKGNVMDKTPPIDFNGHSASKPRTPIYLKYQLRKEAQKAV